MSLTVVCVCVRGRQGYTTDYVYRLKAMVFHHLEREHRFVVLTDHPEKFAGVETVRIPASPHYDRAWWAKIYLFSPVLDAYEGRRLYLDLDSLVTARLEPIVDFPSGFALIPHAGNWGDQGELKVVKRFNSSVMVWDADDARAKRVWDDYAPGVTMRLWGDQDWIGEIAPGGATMMMPIEWFPRLSEISNSNWFSVPETAKVVLCKKPKNSEAEKRWPEFRQRWRSLNHARPSLSKACGDSETASTLVRSSAPQ